MKRRNWIVFAIMATLLVAGTVIAQDSTDVSVQFGWVHTMEYSGFYIAEDEGYYADENLNVELVAGGFDEEGNFIFPIDKVLSGDTDFGLIGGDQLLLARADGAPLVAIAVIYQRSPVVLMSLAESEILQPEDMIGETIAIDLQSATGLSFLAMLNLLEIELEDINVVERTDFTNDMLTSGEVDILDGFVTNQPVALELEGYELNLIFPSDYGVDLYTNVIFTTEEMIAEQPEVVEAFLRATLSGFQAAVDNPQRAAELSVEYNDTLSLEAETESMYRSVPLLNPVGSEPGMMRAEDWEFMHEILLEAGVLEEELDIEAAYTMQFLDAIYGAGE